MDKKNKKLENRITLMSVTLFAGLLLYAAFEDPKSVIPLLGAVAIPFLFFGILFLLIRGASSSGREKLEKIFGSKLTQYLSIICMLILIFFAVAVFVLIYGGTGHSRSVEENNELHDIMCPPRC